MNDKRNVTVEQRTAADPARSAWVAASAGTGKTKVLIDRLLNLLLAGTQPSRLLCLTFTKAAANEMTLRLAERLASWVAASDADLDGELRGLAEKEPTDRLRTMARRLFASVLDAPGGLRIDTIHAFCQSLLRRFPLEAGLNPNFQVLDERSASELLREAREAVLAQAGRDPDLGDALATVNALSSEQGFTDAMDELVAERSRLKELLKRTGGRLGLDAAIRATLGIAPDESAASILDDACRKPVATLQRAAEALLEGSSGDQKRGQAIADWLAFPADRSAKFDAYCSVYFTQAGERRKTLATKAAVKAFPAIVDILEREAERVGRAQLRVRSARLVDSTAAIVRLGEAILAGYQAAKEARGALDYDDLVISTRDLLRAPAVADWVLFKLDGGIDHILIDEAQDTNPEQWEVVQALASEFFVGEGARGEHRTVFAVGDAKQSIFSFQRADPAAFARMREHFTAKVRGAGKKFDPVELKLSFRSTPAVLQAVDAVIAQWHEDEWQGLRGGPVQHESYRKDEGGLVELWPAVKPAAAAQVEPWSLPVEREAVQPPQARLARIIARTIRDWLDRGEILESEGRSIHAGDIMILVRRRNSFVADMVRALKRANVDIAGVDRMVLAEQLAVMDLVALGQFLLLPADDLTLATVLKGPLYNLTEDALFTLAYGRAGTLWDELQRRAPEMSVFAAAAGELGELLARADFVAPYELYADILAARGGRRRLLARLGPEAEDPLDEFLAAALNYEREHAPSLQGFLHWLDIGREEVKRDPEVGARRAVRIMTVHGAKGLQAPIVFLPDTMQTPRDQRKLLWPDNVVLWSPTVACDDAVAAGAREDVIAGMEAEQRRLLYVALTRARDRLYVCGYQSQNAPPQNCWYKETEGALRGIASPFSFLDPVSGEPLGEGYRLVSPQTAQVTTQQTAPADKTPVVAPDWWGRPPPPEPRPPRPLAPSAPEGTDPPVRSPLGVEDDGARFKRGRLIHTLLQLLPEIEPAKRQGAAERFLARRSHGLKPAAAAAIVTETLAVIDRPEFAPLFGPDSVAEVAVVGRIGDRVVSGQIDRLVVTGDEVWIVDYKTNRPPPRRAEDVPAVYMAQLAAYRAVLQPIYPGRTIRTALLWTDGPNLLWVPQA